MRTWFPSSQNRLVVNYVAASSLIMLDLNQVIDLLLIMLSYVSVYFFLFHTCRQDLKNFMSRVSRVTMIGSSHVELEYRTLS